MRCWACEHAIQLTDLVNELPIVGALVHRDCYEHLTGEKPALSHSLSAWLTRRWDRAA
jgi:hypothetical protein